MRWPAVVACPACGNDAELGAPSATEDAPDFGEYDCTTCGYQFKGDGANGPCHRCLLSPEEHENNADAHWDALGIDRDGEPLPANDLPQLLAAAQVAVDQAMARANALGHPMLEHLLRIAHHAINDACDFAERNPT